MRLASYRTKAGASFGIVAEGGLVDIGSDSGSSLIEVLRKGELGKLAGKEKNKATIPLDQVSFEPPVPAPGKIVCIGVNYGKRNEEYKDGKEMPQKPSVFMRTPESLVGHQRPILRPPESEQLDYEGEIAIVVGRAGRRIRPEDATSHIAGLTLMNEGSVRDWMRHGKFNVTQGKNFFASGSCGPWLTTTDEVGDLSDLAIETRVNGELRQQDNTSNLAFSFVHLLCYLSTFMPLAPGDLIATGTPTGSGARLEPPQFLKHGDIVEVSCPVIGTLSNTVEDET